MKKKIYCFIILLIVLVTFMNYELDIQKGISKPDLTENVMVSAGKHLKAITAQNHKYGSEGNLLVEQYIKKELDSMGATYTDVKGEYDVANVLKQQKIEYAKYSKKQKKYADQYVQKWGFADFLDYQEKAILEYEGLSQTQKYEMQGILVKYDNPESDQGVMLVCHYDNAPNGKGAADDGTAVAAMLEAVRTSLSLAGKNDMYFLFTNGEEIDLNGAEAFIENYNAMDQKIPLVLNYEARGVSGSLLLFETSDQNAGTVKEVVKALDYECGYSFFTDIFKFMPNTTDMTPFMKNGYQGINFAFAEDSTAYHNLTDAPEYLSDKSFYETVHNQQKMVEYFSNSDLERLYSKQNVTFFPLFKGKMVYLNTNLVMIFSILVSVMALILIGFFIKRGELKWKKGLASLLLLGIAIITSFGMTLLVELPWTTKFTLYQANFMSIVNDTALAEEFLHKGRTLGIVFLVLLAVVYILVYWLVVNPKRKQSIRNELIVLMLLIGAVVNGLVILLFRGGSYMIALPLFFFAIYVCFSMQPATGKEGKHGKWRRITGGCAAALQMISVALLLMPIMRLLSVCMQLSLPIWCDAVVCALWSIAMVQVSVPFME